MGRRRSNWRALYIPVRVESHAALAACERRWCEWCGRYATDWRPIHAHHVRTRGARGDDSGANLIGLCVDCHDGFHQRANPSKSQLLARLVELGRLPAGAV